MENQIGELTLEQQFKLRTLEEDIKNLTLEQARSYLIEIVKQGMIKDNLMKHWMKQN